MNRHFRSQVRLSCDGKLTRNRANSNFHPQPAIVILAAICDPDKRWTSHLIRFHCMAALAAPSPASTARLFLNFTESTCKSKQSTKRSSEGRILFYHNAQYFLSGCMNLVFSINISLLVLVFSFSSSRSLCPF